MSHIIIECQNCAKRLKIPEKYAGRKISCPNCKTRFVAQSTAEQGADSILDEVLTEISESSIRLSDQQSSDSRIGVGQQRPLAASDSQRLSRPASSSPSPKQSADSSQRACSRPTDNAFPADVPELDRLSDPLQDWMTSGATDTVEGRAAQQPPMAPEFCDPIIQSSGHRIGSSQDISRFVRKVLVRNALPISMLFVTLLFGSAIDLGIPLTGHWVWGIGVALFGFALCNLGADGVVHWIDLHFGKLIIGIGVLAMLAAAAVSSFGLISGARPGTLGPVLFGLAIGLVVGLGIAGGTLWLFWQLYSRFGFFRVTAVWYFISTGCLMMAYLSGGRDLMTNLAAVGNAIPSGRIEPEIEDQATNAQSLNSLAPASGSLAPASGNRVKLESPGDDWAEDPDFTGEHVSSHVPDFAGRRAVEHDQPKLPMEGEPDYHQRLLDYIDRANHLDREHGIRSLNRVRPDDVDLELKKKIASFYKELAYGRDPGERTAGIRGMARWGGKHSTPYLLEILESDPSFVKDELYTTLADLKDPRVADRMVQLLGNFFEHKNAYQCLRRMGCVAEDALIVVAPNSDPEVSLAAICLLAEVGTEKSLPTLRKAMRSRVPQIREMAKMGISQIQSRKQDE